MVTVGARDSPHDTAPDKAQRRTVRHLGNDIDSFGVGEHADGARAGGGRGVGRGWQDPVIGVPMLCPVRCMALLRCVHLDTARTKFCDDPVSERGQCRVVRVAGGEVAGEGDGTDAHRSGAARFEQEEIDPEAGVDTVQRFAEQAQDVGGRPHRPGGGDGEAGDIPIGLEGVEDKAARTLTEAREVCAKDFRDLPKPFCHAFTAGDGLGTWQARRMGGRRLKGPERFDAQPKRLIEPEAGGIGHVAGLEAPGERLAIDPVELPDPGEAEATQQGHGLV